MRRIGRFLAAGLLAAAVCLAAGLGPWPNAARAADYHWIGAGTGGNTATDPADPSTQWNNPANWQEGSLPGASDWVYLPLTNAGSVEAVTGNFRAVEVAGTSQQGALHIGQGVQFFGSLGAGSYGDGRIVQTGGSVITGAYGYLNVGAFGTGSYLLQDGAITTSGEFIGDHGTGVFTQAGGTNVVNDRMNVGTGTGGNGTLNMGGGLLHAGSIYLGYTNASGVLNITDASARIEIAHELTLGPAARLTAMPGSRIHIAGIGPSLYNQSIDENALSGLENMMVFFGGDNKLRGAVLEVAGTDLGASREGFAANFVLGSLVVGDDFPAYLYLLDDFDNGNRSSPEALYVHNLTIGAGSTLDTRGLMVYYDGQFSNQGEVVGGSPIYVPEPSIVLLLFSGLAGLLARRRLSASLSG